MRIKRAVEWFAIWETYHAGKRFARAHGALSVAGPWLAILAVLITGYHAAGWFVLACWALDLLF